MSLRENSYTPRYIKKAFLGTTQIWPKEVSSYHMNWDFTNAPSGWVAEDVTFTSKGAKSTGSTGTLTLSLGSSALASLRNAQYVEIFADMLGIDDNSTIRVHLKEDGAVIPGLSFQEGSSPAFRIGDITGNYGGYYYDQPELCTMIAADLVHPVGAGSIEYRQGYIGDSRYPFYVDSREFSGSSVAGIRGCDTLQVKLVGNVYIKSLEFLIVSRAPDMPAGIYRNESMGVISMSANGYSWISLADKNLGASTVYTSGTPTDYNYGYFYQRGNNHGFSHDGWNSNENLVGYSGDIPGHGPGNYFSYNSTSGCRKNKWSKEFNGNLWGDITDTDAARRGPCDSGRHIPSFKDAARAEIIIKLLGGRDATIPENYLYMTSEGGYCNGGISTSGYPSFLTTLAWQGDDDSDTNDDGYHYVAIWDVGYWIGGAPTSGTIAHIRPFANATYFPNETYWTILYQPS